MTRRLCAWGLLGALLTLPLLGCNLGTRLGGQTVAAGGGGAASGGDDAAGGEATAAPAVREQSAFLLEGGIGRRENGFVRIPAAVTNYSAHWADVTIAVRLFDAADRPLANRNPIAESERMTSQYAIPPGGALYHSYLRDEARLDGVYARHELSLASAQAAPAAGRLTAEITERLPNRPAVAHLEVRQSFSRDDCLGPGEQRILNGGRLATRSSEVHEGHGAAEVTEQQALHLDDGKHADQAFAVERREVERSMSKLFFVDLPPAVQMVERRVGRTPHVLVPCLAPRVVALNQVHCRTTRRHRSSSV